MAGSKKEKRVKQKMMPQGKQITTCGNPDQYYSEKPSWCFKESDTEKWALDADNAGEAFWTEILPKLKAFETETWKDILVRDKKQNHGIDADTLNKIAQNRLIERHIEAESLISLRITGSHRLYGYMNGSIYNILWYDKEHGDNESCVCRSRLKHT